MFISTYLSHRCNHVTNALLLNVCIPFIEWTVNPLHCKCTFALPSPSEFLAEVITNALQYIMICDPLLKLLVILYIMSLNIL